MLAELFLPKKVAIRRSISINGAGAFSHSTPKGVQNLGTFENYKHLTPLECRRGRIQNSKNKVQDSKAQTRPGNLHESVVSNSPIESATLHGTGETADS
jgi:hypothetical protein